MIINYAPCMSPSVPLVCLVLKNIIYNICVLKCVNKTQLLLRI